MKIKAEVELQEYTSLFKLGDDAGLRLREKKYKQQVNEETKKEKGE